VEKIAFYDTKPYDKVWMDKLKEKYGLNIKYFESKLNIDTASLARGSDAVCVFVNDTVDAEVIEALHEYGIRILALRCAGFNNVDFQAAFGKLHVVRVPAYSPYAVAEHAMALLLAVNRKVHRAYNRTRDFNFNINGLTGFDLHGKTVGVVGTGKIGRVFIDICRGFGMNVIAYDPYPAKEADFEYVSCKELMQRADVISLHCPLTPETKHIINEQSLAAAKPGVTIINTSRGALIDTTALLNAIKDGHVRGAGLDVYEEESELFFEDYSNTIVQDDVLARLISLPNVILTSHQAFLTDEALEKIAHTTLESLRRYFDDGSLANEICYQCEKQPGCAKDHKKPCF
jgi:D-lactate dehydrogenase